MKTYVSSLLQSFVKFINSIIRLTEVGMPPTDIESTRNVKPSSRRRKTQFQLHCAISIANSHLTLDRVDRHLAAVHPSCLDVGLADHLAYRDEVPSQPVDHDREMVSRRVLASAEMDRHRQNYSAETEAADRKVDQNCPAVQNVPIVDHYSMASQMDRLDPPSVHSHCQRGPNCSEVVETTKVDPASMSLMVRAMLCIVVYLSRAVGRLESCCPACCPLVSLDLMVERRPSRSCCWHCWAQSCRDLVCRRLDCLSSCFQPRPYSMAGQTRHDEKHLKWVRWMFMQFFFCLQLFRSAKHTQAVV